MPDKVTRSSTQDGIALLLAALHDDPAGILLLTQDLDLEQARQVAVFCAYVAADQSRQLEQRHGVPGHYTTALQKNAVLAAASDDGILR